MSVGVSLVKCRERYEKMIAGNLFPERNQFYREQILRVEGTIREGGYCIRCGKPLTDDVSRARGYGRECAIRTGEEMAKIVGFTGYAQSGKDTAAQFLVDRGFKRYAFADILRTSLYALNPYVEAGASVEYDLDGNMCWGMGATPPVKGAMVHTRRVREIVDAIGWDRAKVEYTEIRELLQRLGTEVGRELFGENFWVERVMDQIKPGENVVITDVRFTNEEKAVHEAGGRVFRITRPGVGAANKHASELQIDALTIDGVIPNPNGIDLFQRNVLAAVGLD